MRVIALLLAGLVLAACSAGEEPGRPADPEASSPTSRGEEPSASPTPVQPRPRVGQCHRLRFDAALAPTNQAPPVRCGRPHTAVTFHVGRLDLVRAGHRLAVDSPSVQQQARQQCTARLADHLGTSPRELRLTMAQPVWFTPTVEDAAAGAGWLRCDLVVVAGPGELARLPRRTRGAGATTAIAMCATARPGAEGFTRVACQRRHTWRAVATVDLPGKGFPSAGSAAAVMSDRCREVARSRAEDPLDFDWSEERPTREQWRAGQRYGICWVPA